MKKAKVVIASVLKPVTDVRAFHKLAISLRETNKYHINIIGFSKKNPPASPNIQFTPIFRQHRLHLSRFLVPFRFFDALVKYRPHTVIITTYELLLPSVLAKFFLRFKLIYDLQENYPKNVLLNQTMPNWLKNGIAFIIKNIERVFHPYVDYYLMAERCYQKEFPHISNFTLLENKFMDKVSDTGPIHLNNKRSFHFVISGTITPIYGVEDAIHWFEPIEKAFPGSILSIVGHVPLAGFREKLKRITQDNHSVQLNLSSDPLPYPVIRECLNKADIVLLPYKDAPSVSAKIPTKLYEVLALHLPVLISPNPLWEELISPYPAGQAVNFSRPEEACGAFQDFISKPLYLNGPGEEVTWSSEKKKWLSLMEQLHAKPVH